MCCEVDRREERRADHVRKGYSKAHDVIEEHMRVISETISSHLPNLYAQRRPNSRPAHRSSSGGLKQKYVGSVRTKCTSNRFLRGGLSKVARTYKALCRSHASSGTAGGGNRGESVGGRGDRPSGEGREHGCLQQGRQNDGERRDGSQALSRLSRQFRAKVSRG